MPTKSHIVAGIEMVLVSLACWTIRLNIVPIYIRRYISRVCHTNLD